MLNAVLCILNILYKQPTGPHGSTGPFGNTWWRSMAQLNTATFNLATLRSSNKAQVISSGFADWSFNHLISIMELTAPSAWNRGGLKLLAAQTTGTISEHLEAPQL